MINISQPFVPALVSYATRGKAAVVSSPSGQQTVVYTAQGINRSGGAIDVGIVRKFAQQTGSYKVFSFDGTDYTNISTALFAGTASTIIGTTPAGKGFAVQSKKRSGLIGLTISQASATGAYFFQYYNGSSFTTLTTISTPVFTSTGDIFLSFLPPNDWAVGGDADLDSSMYTIRVISETTPPGTAVQANAIWVGEMISFAEGVADNSSLEIRVAHEKAFYLESGEGIMPYFGSANAANAFRVAYSTMF